MTIADRFSSLLDRIQPTRDELATYDTHRSTVTRRVKAVYADAEVKVIGSHARGSAVHVESDLDLLARLRRDDVRWGRSLINSRTVLDTVRDELRDRFLETAISRDECAVLVKFAGGRFSVDVVPAFFREMRRVDVLGAMRPVYSIPDGAGGWLETSPEAHNDFLIGADRQTGGKHKRIAQLLKYWSHCRSPRTPLLNFHLEIALASAHVGSGVKSYSTYMAMALELLCQRRLAAHRDPLGISGDIPAARTSSQRAQALDTLAAASDRATKAVDAEARGDVAEAGRLWNLVFNGNFPAR